MRHNKGFASDNNSGVHPEILKAISEANNGHAIAYGGDDYTAKAIADFKKYFLRILKYSLYLSAPQPMH